MLGRSATYLVSLWTSSSVAVIYTAMRQFTPLPRDFYEPSAKEVAPGLLGHWLVRRTSRGLCGGPIVETEAYLCDDPACHGAKGLTARNRVMFGPPGHAYVYLIYGYHFCVNAVCRPAGCAEAVLVRAIDANLGVDEMQKNRPVSRKHHLTNGPAKLCQAMEIERALDGVDLCGAESPLFIARNAAVAEFNRENGPMVTTSRVGITQAVDLPLRFYLSGSRFVSKREVKRET
jgi:DNA-3-methyladenine glycosylase